MFDIVTADEDDASFSIDREGFDYSSLLMRPPGNAQIFCSDLIQSAPDPRTRGVLSDQLLCVLG